MTLIDEKRFTIWTLRRVGSWALVAAAFGGFVACDSATTPTPPAAAFGSIRVTSLTIGPDADGDGYGIAIDGGPTKHLAASGSLLIDNVMPGQRDVRLDGVAANCTTGGGTKAVVVTAYHVADVEFVVTCVSMSPTPVPAYGNLQINIATSGPEPDPDGYTATITNNQVVQHVFLPVRGSVSVSLIAASRYAIFLHGVAPNCRLDTSNGRGISQEANLIEGATATASFEVRCEPVFPARLPAGTKLAFVRSGQIYLVNSDGTGEVRLTDGPSDCEPAWSPDGQRLAFVRDCGGSRHIYLVNADGSNLSHRFSGDRSADPAWSPDGTRIVFSAVRQGSSNLYVIPTNDDGEDARELVNLPGWEGHPSWSADGSRIAFASDYAAYDFTSDVFLTTPQGGNPSQLTKGFNFWPDLLQFFQPAWSPQGSTLAVVRCPQAFYTCDTSELGLLHVDGSGFRSIALTRGMFRPTWSPDGTTIAFSSAGTIGWIQPETGARGFIVEAGHSPAWRPSPAGRGR